MDDEDDSSYSPNHYSVNYHQTYASSHRSEFRNASYAQLNSNQYGEGDEDEEEEEEEVEEENGGKRVVEEAEEEEDEEFDEDDDDNDDDDEIDGYHQRYRKKQKWKSLALGYEFAPRVVATPSVAASSPKPSFGCRNSPADWTEHTTFVLLEAWGDRFLQLGRKSLRSEEWLEVSKKVSQVSKTVKTDTQCRNRLDTLKKKYKKEKMELVEIGSNSSKWVYFKKMDMLMSSSSRQSGLSCGLDSGEYVFMNPNVYLNCSNGLDEMKDSPENSESSDGNENNSDDRPPKKARFEEDGDDGSSFRLLADSILKFGKIYEKIENNKRKQMQELEKMRMEFQRDLELQKRQILERTQAEIAKLQQDDDDEDEDDDDDEEIDVYVENLSE